MTPLLRRLLAVLPLFLFLVALWILHQELAGAHLHDVVSYLRNLDAERLVTALLLTVGAYFVLTGYDLLGVHYAGAALPYPQVALTSFIGYAFSNSVGHALLTATPIRFRLYSAWGLDADRITRIVAFCFATFWVGLVSVAGVAFTFFPRGSPRALHLPFASERPLGVACLTVAGAYLVAGWVRRRPLRWWGWEWQIPRPTLALGQILVAGTDWALAAGVLYTLLPDGAGLTFPAFLSLYLLAQMTALLSQVPGGLGVFETVFLLLLPSTLTAADALGALLAYRAVYFLLPLFSASLALATIEVYRQRRRFGRLAEAAARWAPSVVPQALAFTTFVAGTILLVTGATPARSSDLAWLNQLLPVPVIEASHFLASLAGVLLLVLARGIERQLDAAYHLTVLLLGGGIVFALLRGLDYGAALALAVMLAILLPLHSDFDRPASLAQERLTPGWWTAIVMVVAAAAWLALFALHHERYTGQPWWAFTLHGAAPRPLRAMVVAAVVVLVLGAAWLLRHAPPQPEHPSQAQLERARRLVEQSHRADAHLALSGDKRLLFHGDAALLMFAVEGRAWIALGEPIGEAAEAVDELAWSFHDLARRSGGWPVFYRVPETPLPRYVDMGLSLLKLGEEARVPLTGFTLDPPRPAELHRVVNDLEAAGVDFAVVDRQGLGPLLPELRRISDRWLAARGVSERGFSFGFFDPAYLAHTRIAVVRRNGRPIGFANLWSSAGRVELAPDLVRYTPEAPPEVMTYLFARLLAWGAAEGYGWLNLGMAPLADVEQRRGLPSWNGLAELLGRHGEHFPDPRRLRAYLEGFSPIWEARYLAAPGGLVLRRVLAHLVTMLSGARRA